MNRLLDQALKVSDELLKYKVAISLVEGLGDVVAKRLIAYAGGVQELFTQPLNELRGLKVPGLNKTVLDSIRSSELLERAEEELEFMEANRIRPLFYLDPGYPQRLKYCEDAPVMLYQKGRGELNTTRVLGVVGTRQCTSYGKRVCTDIVTALAGFNVTIVSGMAFGIDIAAHRAAVQVGLPTFGVVAHGLHMLYPDVHQATANKMMPSGGLLSDYPHTASFHPGNFPARNRIVAGMCDALLVVESPDKGGSLITANIANSYNRDVMAVPGRVDDAKSEGCNRLIRTNFAHLIQRAEDITELMSWTRDEPQKEDVQKQLFVNLSEQDRALVDLLRDGPVPIDDLSLKASLPTSRLSSQLLNLEFAGVVRSLPGKVYTLA